jgi:AAA15 family ATPase/GTPase
MLLSFSATNYRSFGEEQTFSMVASNRHGDHEAHLVPIPNDENKALPVAAMYGANAAGKSNLVKGLAYLKRLVTNTADPKSPLKRQPFLLNREGASQATEFKIQFIENHRVFLYGVKLTDKAVSEEWLSEISNGKEISIFERSTDEALTTKIEIESDEIPTDSKIRALAKFMAQPNLLFLRAVAMNLPAKDRGLIFFEVLEWFENRLFIVGPDSFRMGLHNALETDDVLAKLTVDFLREMKTGVDGIEISKEKVDSSILSSLPKDVVDGLSLGESLHLPGEVTVEKIEGEGLQLRRLKSVHRTVEGEDVHFSFTQESDGTRRLLHLIPALKDAIRSSGAVFIVDEIDRSLHSLLAKGFVQRFLTLAEGHPSQLIFTTHDTNFLDLDLLRRDEIWFAEKKATGATELFSLADFKVRTDLKIDKAYLQGRFSAIPPITTEVPDWVRKTMEAIRPKQGLADRSEP